MGLLGEDSRLLAAEREAENEAGGTFGRRVSFLAEGVKRDSEESHLLKALSSGGGCTLKRKVRRPC